MVFDVTMGVRKGDDVLRDEMNRRHQSTTAGYRRILAAYGVPRLDLGKRGAGAMRASSRIGAILACCRWRCRLASGNGATSSRTRLTRQTLALSP